MRTFPPGYLTSSTFRKTLDEVATSRPWGPVVPAEVVWNDRGEPFSTVYNDRYFSQGDGAGESRHVFLSRQRTLRSVWQDITGLQTFCIAETGFGTGLNFLLTWQAWRDSPSQPDLHYIAFEKHPLAKQDLERALSLWPALAPLMASELVDAYPGLLPGEHRLLLEGGQGAARPVVDGCRRGPCRYRLQAASAGSTPGTWMGSPRRAISACGTHRAVSTRRRTEPSGTRRWRPSRWQEAVRRGLAEAGFEVAKQPGLWPQAGMPASGTGH